MSSNVIDLGGAVRSLVQADELAEYTNVELQVDSEHSVYAKAFGALFKDTSLWTKYAGQSGDTATVSGSNITLASTSAVTNWRVRVYTNPAIFTYSQFVGRTVHLRFDVAGTGTSWRLYTGIEVVDKADGGSRIDFKNHTTITQNGSYSFDDAVGDWFESDHPGAYIAFSFHLYCEGAATVEVNNIQIYVDDDSATTLVATCPFATYITAQKVLDLIQGFHYRPYEASGARLDMVAEIGDTVRIDDTGFSLYEQSIVFGSECVSTLSAPFDQELEHEFPYVPSTERRFKRELKTIRADLEIKAGEISAKVSQVGGSAASFGWNLLLDRWSVSANNREVFRINANGAYVYGEIVATKGTIGGCTIENGVLQVSGGNITNINASSITAGTLNVDRIQAGSISSGKLGDGAVTESKIAGSAVTEGKIAGLAVTEGKIGGSAVTTGKIAGGAVTYGKTGFTGTLDQVGTNKSDIAAIKSYFLNILTVNSLTVQGNLNVYGSGGTAYAFRPIAFAQGTIRHILGSTT